MDGQSHMAASEAMTSEERALPAFLDLASLLMASASPIAVFKGADHCCIFANDAHNAAFGRPGASGTPVAKAWPELAGQMSDCFDRVFSTGETCTLSNVRRCLTDENGKPHSRWYRQTLQPWRDRNGRLGGVVSHAHDITQEVEAAETLAKRTAELEFALELAGGVGSWSWDVAADRVTANDRCAALFGVPLKEAQGLPLARFVEAILPEDRQRVEAAIASALQGSDDYLQDYRVQAPNGARRWVTARGRCFRDDKGEVTRFFGVVFDITRQVEDRQQGEHTDALLKSFLDNSASYIFAKDLEGRYILANRFYLSAFGETETSLYGRTDRDRFGEGEPYSSNDRRVAESGMAIEFEEQAVRPDGETIHAISVKFPLRDTSGTLFGTGSISTDVTDRRRAEAALLESEERRLRAMRAGMVGTFEYYPDQGRFVCDDMTAEVMGLRDNHPSLGELSDAFHADERPKWEESRALLLDLAPDARPSLEFRLAGDDGPARWIAITGVVERNEQYPAVFLGTVRDISERKEYEERLGLLNRELSHRVKNLFAVTQGMIRLTAWHEPGVAAFASQAVERIDALAAAHSIGLGAEATDPVSLREMLAAVMRPFGQANGDQIRLIGPDVMIPQHIVTPLALIAYELATNALKHGCLAHTDGRLGIEWNAKDDSVSPSCVELRWSETCCIPVGERVADANGGFGQRLIDASVRQMNGSYRTEWLDAGLCILFVIPLATKQ
jgi:PAS domain S-box-containing protein